MTKEKAIQELIFNKEDDTCLISVEALDMAIKALEQQPSYEDCVSRQAVLDEIKSMSNTNPSYWATCDVIDREDLIDSIKDLPSVTPTHGTCKDCENWNESEVVKND